MTLNPTISQALESFMYRWIGIVAYSATSFEYLKAVNFLKSQFPPMSIHWWSSGT